jgi:hypothetical protein
MNSKVVSHRQIPLGPAYPLNISKRGEFYADSDACIGERVAFEPSRLRPNIRLD